LILGYFSLIFERTFECDEEVAGMCDQPAAMPSLDPSLPVPLAMLVAGLDVMTAQPAADLPGAQALLETQVLLVQLDRLKALVLGRVADVDNRQLHTLDDSPSTSAWVAEQQTSMRACQIFCVSA
jgi:hypothetical protein